MRLSDHALAEISKFEGLRLEAYPDPGSRDGHPWTIGYGHTGPEVKRGLRITKEQALDYLRYDIQWAEKAVNDNVKVKLNQNQFDALVSFTFNVGAGAFRRSTLLRKLNAGGYDDVPGELMKWVKNDGKVMKGLVKRRTIEAAHFQRPIDEGAGGDAPTGGVSEVPTAPKDGSGMPAGAAIGAALAAAVGFILNWFGVI